MRDRGEIARNGLLVALALAALEACVSITYEHPGPRVEPRGGKVLVFGRMRFFHDDREYFPWAAELSPTGVGVDTERHVWLLRLGRRGVSAELHPDEDGSLAIWLAPGDYALLGSRRQQSVGPAAYEVVGLLRVPAGAVAAYAGDLLMKIHSHEGGQLVFSEFGVKTIAVQPIEQARAAIEERLGVLPAPPVSSPWCTGDDLPAFFDPELFERARDLLDHGCPVAR